MPREFGRNQRVADLVQRELALILQRELRDSHSGMVTISTVNVSPDLKNAKVYVTVIGGDVGADELVHELNEQAGHFRRLLARAVVLRNVPKLLFVFDSSIERGSRLSALIDAVNRVKPDK